MRHLKKFLKSKIILAIGMMIVLSTFSFSYWVFNASPIIFYDGNDSLKGINSLDNYVNDGAGYFLEAYANTLLLMKKIEWISKEGVVIDEIKLLADSALKNMESARLAYGNLILAAGNTPYNPDIIEKLKYFDYDDFQKTNGLNPVIFYPVKIYLAKGEIRKLLYDLSGGIEAIISLLKQVKQQLDAGNVTPIKEIWQLNGLFARTLLYGQYVSQVMYCIQGM